MYFVHDAGQGDPIAIPLEFLPLDVSLFLASEKVEKTDLLPFPA